MSPLDSARGFSWQPHRGDIAIAPSGRHRNNQPLGFARGGTLGFARGATLGIARDATVMTYRKIMSVMREKPIWLLIFEMNSCFRRVNS